MAGYGGNRLRRLKLIKLAVTLVFCSVSTYAYFAKTRYTNSALEHRLSDRDRLSVGLSAFKRLAFRGSQPGSLTLDKTSRRLLDVNADDNIKYTEGAERYYGNGVDDDNCTNRGISKFPPGVFTKDQRKSGALVVNFLVAFYLCGVIGYICSAYFVPSLEILCERLGLQPDVAGATFMAAGSSAPELFSAVIGTFISFDDTGLSAIVGSAAFNVFVIISLCCFLTGQEVTLNWWPFVRDCVVYVISILLMVFVIYDSKIHWWEGLILSVGYLVYIAIMYFNPYLSRRADELTEWWRARKARRGNALPADVSDDTDNLLAEQNTDVYGSIRENGEAQTANGVLSNHSSLSESTALIIEKGNDNSVKPRTATTTSISSEHPTLAEHPGSVFSPPSSWFFRVLWFVGFPAIVCAFLTIPDCRKKGIWRKLYFFTFILATTWLAGTAYILYWMIVIIGYTLNIPDTVMGISLLAAGTSVPDAIASVLVARDGYGDMALSNIIGSNIFEVFVCLGFLWFIYGLVFQEPVEIASNGLVFSTVALLLTVAFILLAIHLNGWKLDLKMGFICLFVYVIFISVAIMWELGVVGGIMPPIYCPGPT